MGNDYKEKITMAKKMKFELNLPGLRELLKSPQMQKMVKEKADGVAATATAMSGEEYSSRGAVLYYTSVATAFPDSKEAAHDNYENNTLLKALGSQQGK